MRLVQHAKRELDRVFSDDPDLVMCYIEVISAYQAKQESGEQVDPDILATLFKGHHLGEITNDPDEWDSDGSGSWSNNRDSRIIISDDGGRTYVILPEDALMEGLKRYVSAPKKEQP